MHNQLEGRAWQSEATVYANDHDIMIALCHPHVVCLFARPESPVSNLALIVFQLSSMQLSKNLFSSALRVKRTRFLTESYDTTGAPNTGPLTFSKATSPFVSFFPQCHCSGDT